MRWQIAHLIFDANNQVLSTNNHKTLLEPKIAMLLHYFCQHPNKDISRDELLEHVWHGQIVSDNSINRAVLQLRKALGDEHKIKKFVVTVPKVGYRFIAPVSQAERRHEETTQANRSDNKRLLMFASVAIIILVTLITFTVVNKTQPAVNGSANVSPLIRLAGGQSNADMASDGKKFIYTSINKEAESAYNAIFLANTSEQIPLMISANDGNADHGKWANRDEFIVYLYHSVNRCEFHRVDMVNGIAQKPEVIYQCDGLWYTSFAFSHDNSKLYFIESQTAFSPYQAYELDLHSNNKRLLSQPVAKGVGHFSLDMHPDSGQLLLVSDQTPGQSTLFQLDVEKNSFQQLKSLDYSVYSAIWSHRKGHVIHPAQHPSYQLIESDLSSNDSRVLLSDSRRVTAPKRMDSNDGDYLFTSYLYNRDIVLDESPDININSTVMDYLPALSHDTRRLAFISKRAGFSQVWVKNLKNNTLKSIQPPDEGRMFYQLKWSFDDQLLLANTDAGLLVFDANELSVIEQINLPLPAYGVGWWDHRSVVYSHYENQNWQLYTYDWYTQQKLKLEDWAFALASAEKRVFFDQQMRAYVNEQEVAVIALCDHPIQRYRIKHILDGEDYYCLAKDNPSDLLLLNDAEVKKRWPDFIDRSEFFSISQGKKAITSVANFNSDIMRTNFKRPDRN